MATTNTRIALTVHGAGWIALLAAILLARAGVPDRGGWVVLAPGVAVFVACAVWSAARILDRIRVVDAMSRSRVIRLGSSSCERFSRRPSEAHRLEFSRQASHRFGPTTIRRHDVASESVKRSS